LPAKGVVVRLRALRGAREEQCTCARTCKLEPQTHFEMHRTERELRGRVVLVHCKAVVSSGRSKISLNSVAVAIAKRQEPLRASVALVGCQAVETSRRIVAHLNAVAIVVGNTEVMLRSSYALVCCEAKVPSRLDRVCNNACALIGGPPDRNLRQSMALIGSQTGVVYRLGPITRYALTHGEVGREELRRLDVALVGRYEEEPRCLAVVFGRVRAHPRANAP